MARTELVVALDFNDQAKANELIEKLADLPVIYKVGLELFLSADSAWLQAICSKSRVFVDLKFLDIPNTVASAMVRIAKLGAEFATVHLSGGSRMLDEMAEKVQDAMLTGEVTKKPRVLGVSVLTSFKEEEWVANVSHVAKLTGVRTIQDSVMHYAALASDHNGVQGMVCSPHEVEPIRAKYPNLYLMVPGIRLKGGDANDQSRVMTPAEAMAKGASAIVVGRPITRSNDPRGVVEQILKDIS